MAFLKGERTSEILRKAARGAAISGGLAGGATGIGSAMMGPPEEDDPHAYLDRGAVGGLVGGGIAGAGLGALMAGGAISAPKEFEANVIARYFKQLAKRGSLKGLGIGAGIGAAAGAGIGGYQGWSEGSAVDAMNDVKKRRAADVGL